MKRGCTQCGECLNVCPVFRQQRREEFSPKGKRRLLEPVAEGFSSFSWEEIFSLSRLCAGCGRCKTACARKLSTADLLADVRAAHPHWSQHLWELWISHMGPIWPAIGLLSSLAPDALTPKILESSVKTARALTAKENTAPWLRLYPAEAAAVKGKNVVLFSGCTARNVRRQWTGKAEKLLYRWGYSLLDASAFVCCGGTMHHAGQYKAMERMRRINIAAWEGLGRPYIASFCASCVHSLGEYVGSALEGEAAQAWQQALQPLSSLLIDAQGELSPAKPEKYGYHQPCHWSVDKDMPFLWRLLPGLEKGAGICCGMGGILKMTDPDLSAAMATSCLEGMPQYVREILTGCSGCTMQLSAFAPKAVSVRHWLDIVDI